MNIRIVLKGKACYKGTVQPEEACEGMALSNSYIAPSPMRVRALMFNNR